MTCGINRSFVELKHRQRRPDDPGALRINRSFVELKPASVLSRARTVYSINRSFVELKQLEPRFDTFYEFVSIAPSWS